ncbi:retrovirus-related pol polyprotein from transposon TNT 1-94 [Tanacetum coccineum]
MIDELNKSMTREFEMTHIGLMSYYLSIKVKKTEEGIFICQERYAKEILKRFDMDKCNPGGTPIEHKAKPFKHNGGKAVDSTLFKSLVGSLRYLTCTRPDILFAVGLISRFIEEPTTKHLKIAKRILRYIKCTVDYGMFYSISEDFKLVGYSDSQGCQDRDPTWDRFCLCKIEIVRSDRDRKILPIYHVLLGDSDWAGRKDDGRSTPGFLFFMGNNAFTWSSKKQPIVTLSSCEAGYIAATSCVVIKMAHKRERDAARRYYSQTTTDLPMNFMENRSLGVQAHSLAPKQSRYEETTISRSVNDDARYGVTLVEPYTEEATLAELKWRGGFYMEAHTASQPTGQHMIDLNLKL